MQLKDLKKLKLNERVIWTNATPATGGTVVERGYSGLRVKWDDDHLSTFFFKDDPDRLPFISREVTP